MLPLTAVEKQGTVLYVGGIEPLHIACTRKYLGLTWAYMFLLYTYIYVCLCVHICIYMIMCTYVCISVHGEYCAVAHLCIVYMCALRLHTCIRYTCSKCGLLHMCVYICICVPVHVFLFVYLGVF